MSSIHQKQICPIFSTIQIKQECLFTCMGISSTDSWTVWLILGRVFTLHSYLDMTTETDGDENLNDTHDSIQNYYHNLNENRDDNANSRDLEHDLDFEEELEFVND